MSDAASISILKTADASRWRAVLERCRHYDFHHLAEYHRVAERRGEGEGNLFVFEQGKHTIALPLLLRTIDAAEPGGWRDAASVYGYGGPIASHEELPTEVIAGWQSGLRDALAEQRVVSLFSRLHPLIEQSPLVSGMGQAVANGTTVSIDLTLPEEAQTAQYSKSCRTTIRKLGEGGFVGVHDREKRYLPEFVEVYRETMRRAHAQSSYFFDEDYFDLLTNELGEASHLFVVLKDQQVAAATLCTICDGIVQDHLGGTRDAFLRFSPDRLVVHTERLWAKEMGARVFHLGGGVGSKEDSLFAYKAGFSDRRHTFSTWRWILEPTVYDELTAARTRANAAQGLQAISESYFPAYRCPVQPLISPPPRPRLTAPAMRVFGNSDIAEWQRIVAGSCQHDFYFMPAYHALAAGREGGLQYLFAYEADGYTLAVPLVLRKIPSTESGDDWFDATSVYGYAGPLASHRDIPAAVVASFQAALTAELRARRVVSLFSRLHPLLSQSAWLSNMGEVRPQGQTVAIDLTAPPHVQRGQYSSSLRTRLNRLSRAGAFGFRDARKRHLDEFIDIYHETMHRVGAASGYFFGHDYFAGLTKALNEALQLFVVSSPDGQVLAAGLFTLCDGIVQYHLGGTRNEALPLSPMTMLLDSARAWGHEQGAHTFHLGGGVGATADALFQFKSRFSPDRREFSTWRWILDPAAYATLCDERARELAPAGEEPRAGFFPAYRAPGQPRSIAPQEDHRAEALIING